jgi:hypothetical protein
MPITEFSDAVRSRGIRDEDTPFFTSPSLSLTVQSDAGGCEYPDPFGGPVDGKVEVAWDV